MTIRWLHPAWLTWPMSAESINLSPMRMHERAYILLQHAQALVEQETPSREIRADALVNLRRALDLRVQGLVDQFNLKEVPIQKKPKGSLELLEFFGLVRPMMTKNLVEMRNAVEHQDEEPPTAERLQELCEFLWYFLRSTEVRIRPSSSLSFDSQYIEDEPREEIGRAHV